MLSEKPWRLDAVLMLLSLLLMTLAFGMLLAQLLAQQLEYLRPLQRAFYQFVLSTIILHGVSLLVANWFLRQHGITWKEFLGFSSGRVRRALAIGLIAGVLAVPAGLAVNKLCEQGLLRLKRDPIQQKSVEVLKMSSNVIQRLCFALAAVVLAPLVEETFFRGIIYPAIKQRGHPYLAVFGSALLFAAIHYNLLTFIPLTLFAIFLIWVYERTDSLMAPIATHAVFNGINLLLFMLNERGVFGPNG